MELAGRFRDLRQLERDYLLTLLLHEIYSSFSGELVFKGGTALKYFYSLGRFSEDIDFSYVRSSYVPDRKLLAEKVSKALDGFSMQYTVTEREFRANKKGNAIIGINYLIRVRGPLYQRLGQLQNIRIDISLRDDMILKPETKYLSPIYPDITTFSMEVMNIAEIMAEKIAAITERSKMRDIYDAYYLLVLRNIKYDEKLVEEKIKRRNSRFDKAAFAKKLEAARNKMKWKSELAYIVNPLPNNDEAISGLEKVVGL